MAPGRVAAARIQAGRPLGRSGTTTRSQPPRLRSTDTTLGEPNSVRGRSRPTTRRSGRGAQRGAPRTRAVAQRPSGPAGSGALATAKCLRGLRLGGLARRARRTPASRSSSSGARRATPATGASTGERRTATRRRRSSLTAREQRLELLARVLEPDAPQHLVGEGEVVRAEVGAVVEDRDALLGRLGVGDRGADHGLEDLLAVVLLELLVGLARVLRAHVGDVEHHAEELEVRVVELLRLLDDLERSLHALQREVLRLGGHERPVGGDEAVDRQQAERRRAVDQHQVVLLADVLERLAHDELAAHLARHRALHLGEDRRRGDHAAVGGRLRLRLAAEHVGDRRRRVRSDVEVVRQVALRIEVDGEHVESDPAEHVRQRAHCGGLARAALQRQYGDRLGHGAPP